MVDATLTITSEQRLIRVPRQRIQRAVAAAFSLAGRRAQPLSVTIVDDPTIRRLHREFLGIDTPTDVMSFPLEAGDGESFAPLRAETPIGEVVASAETASREAARRGHPAASELVLYVAHGTLHLLGFDDHVPTDQRAMRAAEQRCLAAAGIPADLFDRD